MSRFPRRRSAPSLVVAVLAAALALGGTALATSGGSSSPASPAAAAKRHKAKPVTAKQLHAYVRRYVRKHPGARGKRGPSGVAGATGATGPRGLPGPSGTNGSRQVEEVLSSGRSIGAGVTASDEATCPSGEVATGGGSVIGDRAPGARIVTPDPAIQVVVQVGDRDGWFVLALNTGKGAADNANAIVQAMAVCSPGVDTTPPMVRAQVAGLQRATAARYVKHHPGRRD